MPLEFPDQKHFEVACGYAQLGLFLEANEQLEEVDAFNRAAPEILALRVEIYRGLEKWDAMAEICKRLAEFDPNEPKWRTDCAYAVRRFQGIEAAREILLAAESRFPNDPIIQFNLGCYCCVAGDLIGAKKYLKKGFAIEPNLRLQAFDDEDLKSLWSALSEI
jgi:tetratricopeptide (TPR) repeat protein